MQRCGKTDVSIFFWFGALYAKWWVINNHILFHTQSQKTVAKLKLIFNSLDSKHETNNIFCPKLLAYCAWEIFWCKLWSRELDVSNSSSESKVVSIFFKKVLLGISNTKNIRHFEINCEKCATVVLMRILSRSRWFSTESNIVFFYITPFHQFCLTSRSLMSK